MYSGDLFGEICFQWKTYLAYEFPNIECLDQQGLRAGFCEGFLWHQLSSVDYFRGGLRPTTYVGFFQCPYALTDSNTLNGHQTLESHLGGGIAIA